MSVSSQEKKRRGKGNLRGHEVESERGGARFRFEFFNFRQIPLEFVTSPGST